MSYQAIYRKFRPATFDKVIGQDHITTTLVNQVKSGKIGHAYLFCGTRGTGKTSTAKIFARAINCLDNVNGSPCGKCANCQALGDNSPDVFEIDAASNNKVENVREIRDKISYPPIVGKYKVYIIDEVHMLTGEAFNALLKTLEEPPAHAVFILATTESYKIPATITSRCMRFDFRLVDNEKLTKLVGEVYDELGVKYEQDAIKYIASLGEGCVRDTLSVAEVCYSFCSDNITLANVLEIMGATDERKITQLIADLLGGKTSESLIAVNELISLGKSVGVIFKELIKGIRDILMVKTAVRNFLNLTQDKYESYKAISENYSAQEILRVLEILSYAEGEIRYSSHPSTDLERAIVKCSMPSADMSIEGLTARVSELERALAGKTVVATQAQEKPVEVKGEVEPQAVEPIAPVRKVETEVQAEIPVSQTVVEKPQPVVPPVKANLSVDKARAWGMVIRALRRENLTLYAVCSELIGEVVGDELVIYADSEGNYSLLNKPEYLAVLQKVSGTVAGIPVKIAPTSKQKLEQEELESQYEEVVRLFGKDKLKN